QSAQTEPLKQTRAWAWSEKHGRFAVRERSHASMHAVRKRQRSACVNSEVCKGLIRGHRIWLAVNLPCHMRVVAMLGTHDRVLLNLRREFAQIQHCAHISPRFSGE